MISKALVFALLFIVISSEPLKLFDLNKMSVQYLENFLAATESGIPITLEECLDNPTFHIAKLTHDPDQLIKGQNIKISVKGTMLSDQDVDKLHLDTYLNGAIIFQDNVSKKGKVAKGPWAYDYEASVPSFTPSGKWEINVVILNSNQEKLSCVKATFITP